MWISHASGQLKFTSLAQITDGAWQRVFLLSRPLAFFWVDLPLTSWAEYPMLPTVRQEGSIKHLPLNDRIAAALSGNPYVPRKTLRFEAAEGRVTLRGVVHSYFQKQMAQEVLRRIEGIDEILNELEVTGGVAIRPGR